MASERDFYVDGWRNVNTPGGEALPFSNLEFPGNAPSAAAFASVFGAGRNYAGEEVYVNPDGTLFLNSAVNRGVGYTGPQNDEFKSPGFRNRESRHGERQQPEHGDHHAS